jgi:hypothetical protein
MGSIERQLTQFRKIIATEEPPLLGPQRRKGVKTGNELSRALADFFNAEKAPESSQPMLRSAALLWHDDLDASHAISQDLHTREGSWLHGIMHRREPDYGNAKYWFRRVAPHEAFPSLAERVTHLLHSDGSGLAGRLIADGEWAPFAFIDECERAEAGSDAKLERLLRDIQALEFDALIEFIFRRYA